MATLRESVLSRIDHPTRAERELQERLRWSRHWEPLAPIPDCMYSQFPFSFEYVLLRGPNEPIGFETREHDGTLYVTRLSRHGAARLKNRSLCANEPYTQFTLNCFDIILEINGYRSLLEMTNEMASSRVLFFKIRRPPGTPTQIELNYVMNHGGWLIVTRDFQAEPLACEEYLSAVRGDVVFVWADTSRLPYAAEVPQTMWIWAAVTTLDGGLWWPQGAGWIPVCHLRVPAVSMGWT